ncbi:hypothetical protein [Micromonospora sp. CPCC 206061]|uniref:hypothetical protein n=1 Tax=Micromonospora sp. CPCC 206061 TaxID=3122410 RepID=UPI002FF01D6A
MWWDILTRPDREMSRPQPDLEADLAARVNGRYLVGHNIGVDMAWMWAIRSRSTSRWPRW